VYRDSINLEIYQSLKNVHNATFDLSFSEDKATSVCICVDVFFFSKKIKQGALSHMVLRCHTDARNGTSRVRRASSEAAVCGTT
jgi:hypothetical protein